MLICTFMHIETHHCVVSRDKEVFFFFSRLYFSYNFVKSPNVFWRLVLFSWVLLHRIEKHSTQMLGISKVQLQQTNKQYNLIAHEIPIWSWRRIIYHSQTLSIVKILWNCAYLNWWLIVAQIKVVKKNNRLQCVRWNFHLP